MPLSQNLSSLIKLWQLYAACRCNTQQWGDQKTNNNIYNKMQVSFTGYSFHEVATFICFSFLVN